MEESPTALRLNVRGLPPQKASPAIQANQAISASQANQGAHNNPAKTCADFQQTIKHNEGQALPESRK